MEYRNCPILFHGDKRHSDTYAMSLPPADIASHHFKKGMRRPRPAKAQTLTTRIASFEPYASYAYQ